MISPVRPLRAAQLPSSCEYVSPFGWEQDLGIMDIFDKFAARISSDAEVRAVSPFETSFVRAISDRIDRKAKSAGPAAIINEDLLSRSGRLRLLPKF